MGHLVAKVGNVYIDLGHAMDGGIVKIIVTKMYQMIQFVVCTLVITLKEVFYSVCFCLILQPIYSQVHSTNIASTAMQQ